MSLASVLYAQMKQLLALCMCSRWCAYTKALVQEDSTTLYADPAGNMKHTSATSRDALRAVTNTMRPRGPSSCRSIRKTRSHGGRTISRKRACTSSNGVFAELICSGSSGRFPREQVTAVLRAPVWGLSTNEASAVHEVPVGEPPTRLLTPRKFAFEPGCHLSISATIWSSSAAAG